MMLNTRRSLRLAAAEKEEADEKSNNMYLAELGQKSGKEWGS
jgi:hypothetical protein